jgi:methylmalonyl-CoA/ethylmalonyl-CoA epimerase
MNLHHLGIACTDILETLDQVRVMFPVIGHSGIIHDPEQHADLCLVSLLDGPPLELITGPIVSKLTKKGISLYHSCWEVEDIETTMAHLCRTANCLAISEPTPAILFDSRRVAFLSTPVGLVELLAAT